MLKQIRKPVLACLLSAMMVFSGCWTAQQWFDLVGSLLPIIGQTYLQFYGLTTNGGVDAGDVAKVQALTSAGQDAIKQVEAIVAAYKAAPTGSELGQINAVLAQLQQSVTAFLNDAQIKNSAKFAEYSGYAQAILADIQDVIALIPVVTPPAPATAGRARVSLTVGVSYSKAKAMKGVFQERLAKLPK